MGGGPSTHTCTCSHTHSHKKQQLKDRIPPHDSASRMKIKRVQKKVTTIYVWSCCALHLLFVLSLLVLSLSLSLCFFPSFKVSSSVSHSPRLRSWRCWRPSQPAEQRLLNVLPKPKQNSSHGSMPESRCRNRKMAELNPSNPSDWNQRQPGILPRGCVAGIIKAEGESTTRTLDELSRPRCHHRNRGRAELRRITSRRRGTRRTRGDRRQELGAGINTGYQKRRTPRTAAPSNLATAALTKTARRAPWDPHRVRKMTTHRKGFVQYCKKPRTSQQCQRPACHVHLRGACGRDVGDVEEGIESGRTLSPESEILLPLLVEMPRSRANRICSSEQDTGIGTVSSALIRDFAIKSAASSARLFRLGLPHRLHLVLLL